MIHRNNIRSTNENHSEYGLRKLLQLALPVIASSFLSMAYSFINILFVGRLGSGAVAAVGTASFYMNLSWSISALITVGTGIKVSHAVGKKDLTLAKGYIRSGLLAVGVIAFAYLVLLLIFNKELIGFVKLNDAAIEAASANYLMWAGLCIPFAFLNLFFTSVFIGYGDSRSPFRINATAFALNILLDPILIFLVGLGIKGAAIATILSQVTATVLFFYKVKATKTIFPERGAFSKKLLKDIIGLGVSPAVQRVSFTIVAIFMARIISDWGPAAIAVQKVGVQIEAISYMTAGGFLSALSAMSGKAYGAKNYQGQWVAFKSGIKVAFVIGVVTSSLFILFPEALFSIFINEEESIAMGAVYLKVLGFSQLFMCLEMVTTGAFFGWGKTNIPAITSISLTVLRIPMALLFIQLWSNSLVSVWWSISISSMAKGIILTALFIILFKLFLRDKNTMKRA